MGVFLNPGNSGFARILRGKYVDKTGMLSLINKRIDTPENLICISRPRRFGKSFAAQMLCAYYDKSCDSSKLFADLDIAKDSSYDIHRNRYDVIYLDMTNVIGESDEDHVISYLKRCIISELKTAYPALMVEEGFSSTLVNAVELIGNKFIMIIDEWDAPIREMPGIQKDYLHFLRTLFKSSNTTSRIFAAAYMTGILPIKKDGSQSAISDFDEYTMLFPDAFSEYVGFTEEEVRSLCTESKQPYEEIKRWYDGYAFHNTGPVYNPNSVMKAVRTHMLRSYWTETSAAEGLMDYISRDYSGLTKTIAELIGGVEVQVSVTGFANDLVTFKGKDDVLTLLIHLGYLAYDSETGTARIPNEEVRQEFEKSIRLVDHAETMKRLEESDQLFDDTVHMREEAVAAQIEKVHLEETDPRHYNSEDSLRSVIKLAYYTYRDNYLMWEELPGGKGYADMIYFPKRADIWPALVVELKWNRSAEGAITQILDKKYPDALKGYGGEILLVGVNYDAESKEHSCVIRKAE